LYLLLQKIDLGFGGKCKQNLSGILGTIVNLGLGKLVKLLTCLKLNVHLALCQVKAQMHN